MGEMSTKNFILEKENVNLKIEVESLKKENRNLKRKVEELIVQNSNSGSSKLDSESTNVEHSSLSDVK